MNSETILYRQIHPSWIRNNRVTSQAFRPTPKDNNELSVYDGDIITAEESWKHHAIEKELESDGVMAVTVAECLQNGRDVTPDPDEFPSHALIDFEGLTHSKKYNVSKALLRCADARGWQFRPEP